MTEKKQNTDAIKSPRDDCISTNVYENNVDIACSRLSSYSINDDKTDFSNKIKSPKANNFRSQDLQNRSKSCVSYINSNVSYKNNDDDIKSTQNDSSASLQSLFHNGYYGKFDTRFQAQGYKYAYSKLTGYDNVDIDVARRKSKVKICSNCQTQETPSWRRSMDRKSLLCNACGLYQRLHNRPRPFFKNFDGKTRAIKPTSYVYICHCCNKVSKMSWKRTLDGKQICNYCSFFNKDILYGNDFKQHIPFRASRFNFAFDRNKSSNLHKTSNSNYNIQLHSVSDICYQNTLHESYDQDAGLGQIPQVDVDNTDGINEGLKDYRSMDMYRLSEEYNSQNKSDTDDYEYFEDQMTPRSFKKSF